MAKKLSGLQVEVLRAVKDGLVYRSESIGTLYKSFRKGVGANVTRQADALADADPQLIAIGVQSGTRRPWYITEAGVKVLADLDAKTTDTI